MVILAPDGHVLAVRESLRDLSAIGFIEPFAWVPESAVHGGTLGALSVRGGRLAGTSLQTLATSERFDRVRLVSLVPVYQGIKAVESSVEQAVAEFLEGSTGGAPLTRMRVIITRIGETTTSAELARTGWHNVLLAPEESVGPGLGHALLQATDDASEVGRHAAFGLAGVAGLWTGVSDSPFDEFGPAPGQSVRIARSYFRKLHGASLEAELRARVTSTSEALPLPAEGGSSATYVEDTALATDTMAKELWARHPDILKGPRERRVTTTAKPIGAWTAVKMFMGFLWASVKNSPQTWFRNVVVAASSRVAGAVHGAVFGGSPSAYAVVVGGVTASGLPASWLDLAEAADSIESVLDESGEAREHHALGDFSALWKEYVAGAMTLADGGNRVQGLSPIQIGAKRAILRSVDRCVPPPISRFESIPGHIAAQIEVSGVDAFDVLAINNLHARLSQMQREAQISLEVGGTLRELETWNTQHKGSYAGRVGSVIGAAIVGMGAEVKSLLEGLKRAGASEDMPAALLARQKKLGKTLRRISLVFAAVGAIVATIFGLGLIVGALAIVLGIGTVVSWFVSTVLTFARGQRDLFRMLNSRQEVIANAEVMKRNLRFAVRDLRRLTDVYSQFLAWSKILSSVLAAPLGRSVAVEDDGGRLGGGLPLGIKMGTAAVEQEALSSAVVTLRREIFRTGWLDEPWEALIAAAPKMIGPEAYELQDDPSGLFSQPGNGDTSLLLRWVDRVAQQGVDPAVADRLWQAVREQLNGEMEGVAESLLGAIRELGGASKRDMTYRSFMANVDQPSGDAGLSGFDPAVFRVASRASASTAIDKSWGRQQSLGLSRTAVLTQLSAGAPPYVFAAYDDGAGGAPGEVSAADADLVF